MPSGTTRRSRRVFASVRVVLVGGLGIAVLAVLVLSLVGAVVAWRRGWRAVALLLPAVIVSGTVTLVIHDTPAPGAAVIGWPLAWGLALFPLPALGLELTPDRAFPVGLAIGLAANGVTTVATAYSVSRDQAPLRRPRGSRSLRDVARLGRDDRRSSGVGERPVGHRRRPSPLHGTPLDDARDRRPRGHAGAETGRGCDDGLRARARLRHRREAEQWPRSGSCSYPSSPLATACAVPSCSPLAGSSRCRSSSPGGRRATCRSTTARSPRYRRIRSTTSTANWRSSTIFTQLMLLVLHSCRRRWRGRCRRLVCALGARHHRRRDRDRLRRVLRYLPASTVPLRRAPAALRPAGRRRAVARSSSCDGRLAPRPPPSRIARDTQGLGQFVLLVPRRLGHRRCPEASKELR